MSAADTAVRMKMIHKQVLTLTALVVLPLLLNCSEGESQLSSPYYTTLSSGWLHTCALRDDGAAVCWGAQGNDVDYEKGQANPPPDERFIAISSGSRHTCGLQEGGTAVC